ncbi:GroES-like protein [Zopfia rhizophila CBS 207.26]|uniref:GroES-like protein n=1 Tax=Zopfia rhizophila CBS 207.26 TaxID=1314779 RepID=A0A6A6EG06_9PEZI|nr:GroES-like protein [Zopfia rhizophila CBS 207.26]
MKAAQFAGYEIREVSVPQTGDNDVLVKVGNAGFCHTDYQVWKGGNGSPYPIVPSHEPVGTVVAVGPAAQAKWKVDYRVGVILFRHACKTCIGCETTEDIRYCANRDMAGLTADGARSPLMCAGATVWAGLHEAKVEPSQPIGVIGIGGLGSLAVQLAKAVGHPVVAIDNRPERRELGTEFPLKADLVVDSQDSEAIAKCVPLGVPTRGCQFNSFDLIFKTLTIKGSLAANRIQTEEMSKTVAKFNIRSHVTTIPLGKVPDVTDLYMDPHLKGRLVMNIES